MKTHGIFQPSYFRNPPFLGQSGNAWSTALKYRQNKALTVGVLDVEVDVEGGLYVSSKEVARHKVILGVMNVV